MLSQVQYLTGRARCEYAQTMYNTLPCCKCLSSSPATSRTTCRRSISRHPLRPISSGSLQRPPRPSNTPSQPPGGRSYRAPGGGSLDLRSATSELRQLWQKINPVQVNQDPVTGICLNPPQPGSLGRPVRLLTNHYAVGLSPAFQSCKKYTVSITQKNAAAASKTKSPSGPQGSAVVAIPLDVRQQIITEVANLQSWKAESWQFEPSSNRLFSLDALTPGSVDVQLPGTSGQQGQQAGTVANTKEFQVTISQAQQLTTPGTSPGVSDLLDLLGLLMKASLLAVLPQQAVQTARSFLLGPAATSASASPSAGRGAGRGGQRGGRGGGRGGPAAAGAAAAGSGLQLWEGIRSGVRLSAALRPGAFRLDVQLDYTAGGVVPAGPLSDQLLVPGAASPAALCGNKSLCKQAEDMIRGVKVTTSHLPGSSRSRKVKGLDPRSPEKYTFPLNGTTTTVAKYFRSTYPELQLKHLHDWPCVMVGNNAAIPLELCSITEPQSRTALNASQLADLVRVSALPPGVRLRRIRDTMQGLLKQFRLPLLQNWGISVSPDPLQVTGRILPDAKLQYASSKCADAANKGQWRGQPFVRPAKLQRWAVVNLAGPSYRTGVDAFVDELYKQLQQQGVTGSKPALVQGQASAVQAGIEEAVAAAGVKAADLQLLLVVLPDDKGELYNAVKEIAGARGIVTQCLVAAKAGIPAASRGQGGVKPAYVGNLVLKVNNKLGGVNWQLPEGPEVWAARLNTKQLMVLGIDVGHGTAGGSSKKPSTSAVTGSLDRGCSRYGAVVMQQSAGEEIVLGLQEAVQQLLRDRYVAMAGSKAMPSGSLPRDGLPDSLMVYRDGVSDSQYTAVLQEEVAGIRRACEVIGGPNYKPKVTFIVVSRSHGTRLFPHPGDPNSSDQSVGGRSGNVVPGTVVDQLITALAKFEFFLNSHAGIQGTNRPARYNVLVDDNRLGQDGLQLITMYLTSLYFACTRYADKAARIAAGAPGSAGAWVTVQAASPGFKAREYRVLDISRTLAGKMWFA